MKTDGSPLDNDEKEEEEEGDDWFSENAKVFILFYEDNLHHLEPK